MLFNVSKKRKDVVCMLEEVNFKDIGILERNHIEAWIETNPEILGEDLLIITKEFSGFDKTDERLDILALDKNANLVVIELKRDNSGKDVVMQSLKYAAYCSTLTFKQCCDCFIDYRKNRYNEELEFELAREFIQEFLAENKDLFTEEEFDTKNNPRIIILSKEFRPEITATILWLRDKNISNLDITCIKLTPYQQKDDDEKIFIDSSIIIPMKEAEDYIIRKAEKEIAVLQEKENKARSESTYKALLRSGRLKVGDEVIYKPAKNIENDTNEITAKITNNAQKCLEYKGAFFAFNGLRREFINKYKIDKNPDWTFNAHKEWVLKSTDTNLNDLID